MHVDVNHNGMTIITPRFDIGRSCACGQAFRWRKEGDGAFFGVVRGRGVRLCNEADGTLRLTPCDEADAPMWADYFDLHRDYGAIEAAMAGDARLSACMKHAGGIRIFNQEPFETLISFIISANNNMKRVALIIERLCRYCGEKRALAGKGDYYCFPDPNTIADLSVEELVKIGAGYRAPFIKASARRIAEGYDLCNLIDMPLFAARRELLAFMGVGPKVADCVLLFSLRHADAFPVDVWIGRALRELFFEGEKPCRDELDALVRSLGRYSGIVQQYIFHYAREVGLGK